MRDMHAKTLFDDEDCVHKKASNSSTAVEPEIESDSTNSIAKHAQAIWDSSRRVVDSSSCNMPLDQQTVLRALKSTGWYIADTASDELLIADMVVGMMMEMLLEENNTSMTKQQWIDKGVTDYNTDYNFTMRLSPTNS